MSSCDPRLRCFNTSQRCWRLRLQCVTGYLADLKRQYAEHGDHLGMVDEVLGTLLHQQRQEVIAGPDQGSDPRL